MTSFRALERAAEPDEDPIGIEMAERDKERVKGSVSSTVRRTGVGGVLTRFGQRAHGKICFELVQGETKSDGRVVAVIVGLLEGKESQLRAQEHQRE